MRRQTWFKVLVPILFTLILLEGGARLYFHLTKHPGMNGVKTGGVKIQGPWKKLPYEVPVRNGNVTKSRENGELILDVPFSIDPGSRRISLAPETRPEKFLVFVGCSYTFGTGVRDHETLPSQVQKNQNDYHVYNYGVPGASPEEVLYRLENIDAPELKEKSGRVVYTFFGGHLLRHFKRPDFVGSWGHWKFVYRKVNGRVENIGRYSENFPVKTFLYKMRVMSKFMLLYKIAFPETFSEDEFREFARYAGIMSASARRLTGKNMVMILWPSRDTNKNFPQYLKENQVDVLDLTGLNLASLTNNRSIIPFEGHPTSHSYEVIAKNLVKYLDAVKE